MSLQSRIRKLLLAGSVVASTPLAPQAARFEPLNPGLNDASAPWLSSWLVGQAVSTVVSPDQKTLLILTSGYNRVYTATPSPPYPWNIPDSSEYVFIYDISTGIPIKKQVLAVANTYNGIVFDPSGAAVYVAGGPSDNLHIFAVNATGTWAEAAGSPIPLNHVNSLGVKGVGLSLTASGTTINTVVGVTPCAAAWAFRMTARLWWS